MDKGPFFVLIFSFRQAIALPVLRFCGLERFCKMHEAVYSPMHEDVYGRFRRLFSMQEVVYHCTRPFTSEGRNHCTRSFTPIYKNQCTRSFTTFSEFRRPGTIGRLEPSAGGSQAGSQAGRPAARQAARPADRQPGRQQKRRHNMPPFRCITIYAIKPYTFLATHGTCDNLRFNKIL